MIAVNDAPVGAQAVGVFLADEFIGDEIGQHAIEGEAAAAMLGGLCSGFCGIGRALSHDREYKRIP